MKEYRDLGEEQFLSNYGRKPAQTNYIVHKGIYYPLKAIVAAAHPRLLPSRLAPNLFHNQLKHMKFTIVHGASSPEGKPLPGKKTESKPFEKAEAEIDVAFEGREVIRETR